MNGSAVVADERRESRNARELGLALGLAAVGALGVWPGARGEPSPTALLVWLSCVASPAGWFAGASRLRLWPMAPVVPALWMMLLGLADALAARDVPSPGGASLAFTGLFALGFAGGRLRPSWRWPGTAITLLVVLGLSSAVLANAFLARPLPSALRARLLDLSPATFLAECAGLDWMRHPVVYDRVATVDIDPTMRSGWSGVLAGGIVFVVGSVLALSADRWTSVRAQRSST